MTFVSRNHGIFTFFAKFYVRCRKWRRKEHIRRKRLCNRPSGLFSPFLFGISLIFWNIFGVYASSGVTTMSNKNNFNSTTKIDNDTNNNKERSLTTTLSLGTEIITVTSTCEDKTCSISMPSEPRPSDNDCPSAAPCDVGLDFSVCNMNINMTESERTRKACKNDNYNYTCVLLLNHTNDLGDKKEYCPAQRCLDLALNSYNCCAKCLCETREKDILSQKSLTKFSNILSRVDCKRSYSLWNCTQCKAVYRDWLCATHGLYQFENETKPCLDMCTSVMSHCPYLVPSKLYGGSPSFLCPEFSDLTSKDQYAHGGQCFKCRGAELEPPSDNNYSVDQPCEYIIATSGSRSVAIKFVLPVWLIFLMRICVYFNTASYS
ncbi:uncharacterized protein LOC117111521 [Anneissia japonica]|uniref:uncharacterized protein LOC117111521 n=1 Tax=Anneissia japonica TaxID=1529436 RepID=UPI0014255E97|nr:uncharacterized protein LOC117111521 [Anneissia japonica]